MKIKNIFFNWIFIIIGMISFSSCNDFIGGDTNLNPNKTNDANFNTLAPTIMYYTAENVQATATVANQYAQNIGAVVAAGADAQNENTFTGVWNNIYLNIIPNANAIIKKSQSTANADYYVGIANTLIAFNLALGSQIWENVPYSQADQPNNYAPTYDSQESIYKEILKLLDDAIIRFNTPATEVVFKPSSDDIIFKGNIDKWKKVAHTLKARYLLHLLKKGGDATTASILDNLSKGILTNADDFDLLYTDRNFNLWYQTALSNNTGNLTTTFSSTFMDLLNGSAQGVTDPRVSLHAYKTSTTDTLFRGKTPGLANNGNTVYNNGTSFFGWNFRVNTPIQMITNSEARFIEAETRLIQNGGTADNDVYNAYLEGIRSNMTKMGVSVANIDAFLAHPNIGVGSSNLSIAHIMTEKYKALFLNPESWTDLRRYDYSSNVISTLILPENQNPDIKGTWIQRGQYPASEGSRNSKNVTANIKPLNSKMWIFN